MPSSSSSSSPPAALRGGGGRRHPRRRPLLLLLPVLAVLGLALLATAAAQQQPTPSPSLALSFSGSGFLALFHAGALAQLQELGLATRSTPVAGASGGTLVAGVSCLGLSSTQAEFVARSILNYCGARRSCAGDLDRAVRAAVLLAVDTAFSDAQAANDPDAAAGDKDGFVKARCSGVGQAYLTKLIANADDPTPQVRGDGTPTFDHTEAWAVSDFAGVDDFVAAGAGSSYIPFFSGSAGFTSFRGAEVMDGGFRNMLPPCPADAAAAAAAAGTDAAPSTCVRVSAVVAGAAVVPGLPKPGPAEISPGLYGPLPLGMTTEQWGSFALTIPGAEAAAAILQHGRDMALAWARAAVPEVVVARAAATGGEEAGAASATGTQRARKLLALEKKP